MTHESYCLCPDCQDIKIKHTIQPYKNEIIHQYDEIKILKAEILEAKEYIINYTNDDFFGDCKECDASIVLKQKHKKDCKLGKWLKRN